MGKHFANELERHVSVFKKKSFSNLIAIFRFTLDPGAVKTQFLCNNITSLRH